LLYQRNVILIQEGRETFTTVTATAAAPTSCPLPGRLKIGYRHSQQPHLFLVGIRVGQQLRKVIHDNRYFRNRFL
jgi:hypothetical protein